MRFKGLVWTFGQHTLEASFKKLNGGRRWFLFSDA